MEDGGRRNEKSPELVMPVEGNTPENQKTHQSWSLERLRLLFNVSWVVTELGT